MSEKVRLDNRLLNDSLVSSRSQADNYIRLGVVTVDGKVITKAGYFVSEDSKVSLKSEQYVSRAGLKLASVAKQFNLQFADKLVLDVGSSTGGFTDYALQHRASKVIAVDVGTNQLHQSLRTNNKVELHEQTDIRDVTAKTTAASKKIVIERPDIVVIDVSFISLRHILPHIATLVKPESLIIAMCKPQFEAGNNQKNKGVIKNDKMRRDILHDFEAWLKERNFVIKAKSDSSVSGTKGNVERFYKLQISR